MDDTERTVETEKHRHSAAYWKKLAKSAFYRLCIFFLGTVLFSAPYKALIKLKFFNVFTNRFVHDVIFCGFELALLGAYWYATYVLSRKSRHRLFSLRAYYLSTLAVLLSYSFLYLLLYFVLSTDAYGWLFRVTFSFRAFTMKTDLPDELLPYMLPYLVGTWLVMLLEPKLSAFLHREQKFKANETIIKIVRRSRMRKSRYGNEHNSKSTQAVQEMLRRRNERRKRNGIRREERKKPHKTAERMLRRWDRLTHPRRYR